MEGILFTNNTSSLIASDTNTSVSSYIVIGLIILMAIPVVLIIGAAAVFNLDQ